MINQPSLRDLVYRWMDDPEFWRDDLVSQYQVHWIRWKADKLCGFCIYRVKQIALMTACSILKEGLTEEYVKRFGVIQKEGEFERFLQNPFETEDFPPDD